MSYQAFKIALDNFKKRSSPEEKTKKKDPYRRVIITLIFIGLFVIAAIKNPNKMMARELVKDKIVTIVEENIADKMSKTKDGYDGFSLFVGKLFVPALIDNHVKIDISDYIFFSTYNAELYEGNEKKTISSGVIFFGKLLAI